MAPAAARYTVEALLGPLNEVERKNAPREVFVAGDPGLIWHDRRVSVVGSRAASKDGLAPATKLARLLVDATVIVEAG